MYVVFHLRVCLCEGARCSRAGVTEGYELLELQKAMSCLVGAAD